MRRGQPNSTGMFSTRADSRFAPGSSTNTMTDDLTHTVTITVTGKYPHGSREHCSVTLAGDGDLHHMIEAFKASLVAAGFSMETAAKLDALEA